MSLINDLREELKEFETLKQITGALTDINALKVKKIRAAFERNHRFFDEIGSVYHLVNASIPVKKSGKNTRSGSLSVAVTSNSHFYGLLNLNVMQLFEEKVEPTEDLLVIGKTGITYGLNKTKLEKAQPLRFQRDFPTPEESSALVRKMDRYERVLVYYPHFETVITQTARVFDLTQRTEGGEEKESKKPTIIFEPEIGKISDFFERQVRAILFQKVMLETDLSRTAARLMAMNEASEKNDDFIKSRRSLLGRAVKASKNARLLETFSGMRGWRENI